MSVITLTESAAAKVKLLTERDGRAGYSLRLKVVGGGCSGLQYQLMFDDKVGDWDQTGESNGVNVVYALNNPAQYPAWHTGRLADHPGLTIRYIREMAGNLTVDLAR